MLVWIVVYNVFYEDTSILAVCLSKERAIAYKDEYIKNILGLGWDENNDRDIDIIEMIAI